MQFVWFMVNIAWKILLVGFGFWVFRWILGDGKETLKMIFQTIVTSLQTGCILLKMKLSQKKEKSPELIIGDIDDSFDPKLTLMTYEEWQERMRNHQKFQL